MTLGNAHNDCISCKLSEKHPSVVYTGFPLFFKELDNNKLFSTFRVSLKSTKKEELDKYIAELKRRNLMDVRIIRKTDNSLDYYSDFICAPDFNFFYTLWKNNIHHELDFTIADGEESFTLMLPDKEIKQVMESLDPTGTIRLLKKTDLSFQNLTDIEIATLNLASSNGYYNIKRGIRLEDLAKRLGVARTTIRNNLRRAERKLFPEVIKRL